MKTCESCGREYSIGPGAQAYTCPYCMYNNFERSANPYSRRVEMQRAIDAVDKERQHRDDNERGLNDAD
ncbi:MAG: hypothetical protein U9Q07_03210 [Planctomycetota bacterium]|nr:hypothetical protein [Planctomycetota bacterium]